MNKKKFFTIVFCILGITIASLGGVVAARMLAIKMGAVSVLPEITGLEKAPKGIANVLVLGVDKGEMRTDTIMLASLDNKNKMISILSIPRDTRVKWDGNYDKITHIMSYEKGYQGTIEAVKEITGLPINYYAIVDIQGFRDMVDILDGVEIDVPNINHTGGMYYKDPVQNLNIALKAGKQVLNGKQAEGFVRFRSGYANADLGRISAQQTFIKAMVEQKLKPQYIAKAPQIFNEISESVKTNYGVADLTSHLITLKKMTSENVRTFQLPGEGKPAQTRYGTLSCFIYYPEQTKEMIAEYFSGKAPVEPSPSPSSSAKN